MSITHHHHEEHDMPHIIDSREAALDYLLASHATSVAKSKLQLGASERAPFVAHHGQQLHDALHQLGVTDEELNWGYARVSDAIDAARAVPLYQPAPEGGPLTVGVRTMAVACPPRHAGGCGAAVQEPCQSVGRPIEGFHNVRHEAAGTKP